MTSISEDAIANSAANLIPASSVLVVTRSGILAHSLPVAINERPVTINQDLKALSPLAGVLTQYLVYALKAHERAILSQCVKDGTTVHSIEAASLLEFRLPIAPRPEQRRIVAKIEELFSELDESAESLMRARAQLRTYRQALLKAAFEGKLTEDWRTDHQNAEQGSALRVRVLRLRRQQWEEGERERFRTARDASQE